MGLGWGCRSMYNVCHFVVRISRRSCLGLKFRGGQRGFVGLPATMASIYMGRFAAAEASRVLQTGVSGSLEPPRLTRKLGSSRVPQYRAAATLFRLLPTGQRARPSISFSVNLGSFPGPWRRQAY